MSNNFFIIVSFFAIDILMVIRFIYVDKKSKKQNEISPYVCEKDKVDEMLSDIFFPYERKQKVD